MYKFVLYYEQKAPYQDKVRSSIEILEKIREVWKADFKVVMVETMGQTEVERVKDDIRSIPPQVRGKIVSGGNMVLPLSRNKNLNSKNTPILMLCRDDRPVNVYPHMLGTTYFEIGTQLSKFLRNGLEAQLATQGLLEEPIQKILADAPSILEEGMRFLDANKDVGFGVADVLLHDSGGRVVVVEIETKATEDAVAQVSRLAAGYASQTDFSPENVRKIILCQSYDGKTVKACRGAVVELYRLTSEKVC
ncbi:MAG: endonuclease NucS [Candidatus Bathyarchaeota archaeon]|nr:endonuclease NucS [Candidatus Bathyarchaeota archaeon]